MLQPSLLHASLLPYSMLMTLGLFALAYRIAYQRLAPGATSTGITSAALLLVFGMALLGGGFVVALAAIPLLLCFTSCVSDLASALPRPLLTALAAGAVCCGVGWTVALVLLARARRWAPFSLALLALPCVIVISLIVLASVSNWKLLPQSKDELDGWLLALGYFVLPLALCWPLVTFLAALPTSSTPAQSA